MIFEHVDQLIRSAQYYWHVTYSSKQWRRQQRRRRPSLYHVFRRRRRRLTILPVVCILVQARTCCTHARNTHTDRHTHTQLTAGLSSVGCDSWAPPPGRSVGTRAASSRWAAPWSAARAQCHSSCRSRSRAACCVSCSPCPARQWRHTQHIHTCKWCRKDC